MGNQGFWGHIKGRKGKVLPVYLKVTFFISSVTLRFA